MTLTDKNPKRPETSIYRAGSESSHKQLGDIVLLFISIIYGILDLYFSGDTRLSESVFRFFTILFVSNTFYKVFTLPQQTKQNEKEIKSLSTQVKSLQNEINGISEIIERNSISSFINEFDDNEYFATPASDLHHEVSKILTIRDHTLMINHDHIALTSYLNFWKNLVRLNNSANPLTVHCIQCFEMSIYINDDNKITGSLLNEQSQFTENGGKITRILVGNGDEPDEKIKKAANIMINHRMEVRYFNFKKRLIPGYRASWDFAQVLGTNHAFIWDEYNTLDGVPTRAAFTKNGRYKGSDLEIVWTQIYNHSNDIHQWIK